MDVVPINISFKNLSLQEPDCSALAEEMANLLKPLPRRRYIIHPVKMRQLLVKYSHNHLSPDEIDLIYSKFIFPPLRQARRRIRKQIRRDRSSVTLTDVLSLFPWTKRTSIRKPHAIDIRTSQRIVNYIIAPFPKVKVSLSFHDLIKIGLVFEDRLMKLADLLGTTNISQNIMENYNDILTILDR